MPDEELKERCIGIGLSAGQVQMEELVHPGKVVIDPEQPQVIGTKEAAPNRTYQDSPCRSCGR